MYQQHQYIECYTISILKNLNRSSQSCRFKITLVGNRSQFIAQNVSHGETLNIFRLNSLSVYACEFVGVHVHVMCECTRDSVCMYIFT